MLNAEDRYINLSNEPEFRALLRDAKPVVLYDLAANLCLWCNVAAAGYFANGGLEALLDRQVPSLSAALPNLKSMAGRLVHEGQKTLARLRLGGAPLAGLATVSIQRKTLATGERPLLIRFLDAPDQRADEAALRRFFFGYDDVREAVLPRDDRQAEQPFNAPGTFAPPAEAEAPEAPPASAEDGTALTPDEQDKFRAIADALGMRLSGQREENAHDAAAEDAEAEAEETAGSTEKNSQETISEELGENIARDENIAGDEDEGTKADTTPLERAEEPQDGAPAPDAPTPRDDKVVALKGVSQPQDPRVEESAEQAPSSAKLVELSAHRQRRRISPADSGAADWQPVVLMKEGSVLEANAAALTLFSVASQEELARSDAFARFLAAFRAAAGEPFEIYNAGGEPLRLKASAKPLPTGGTSAEIILITRLEREEEAPLPSPGAATEEEETLPPEAATEEAFTCEEEDEEAAAARELLEALEDESNVFYIEEDGDVTALREEVADLETTVEELERALALSQARERELRAVLGTATDGVLILDEEGRVISMNAGAEALLGRDENTILGRHFTDLLTLASRGSARSYFESVAGYSVASLINDGREVMGLIDGKEGAISLFMSIGRLGDEQVSRFCAVFRDITPWKKTEAELLEARRRAELASQQKTEFLAKISHEVRTPLNAIIGFSDVMLEERFGPIGSQRYRSYLHDIKEGGHYVISLVNDLLDLAKIEAGRMDMSFEEISINDTVQSVQSMVQPQAAAGRVIMRYSLADGLPDVVADQRALKQVLVNVLSNAVKFTDAGGQVIVSTRREDDGGIAIRIRDTGEGMNADELALALKPFRQVGNRKKGGTGLGLPLSRALTEANRAHFLIESEKGVGTTVSILFSHQQVCRSSRA